MTELPNCLKCESQYTYVDGKMYVCSECAHEWTSDSKTEGEDNELVITDANRNNLNDGDTVTVIKDLKLKEASSFVKVGTK